MGKYFKIRFYFSISELYTFKQVAFLFPNKAKQYAIVKKDK